MHIDSVIRMIPQQQQSISCLVVIDLDGPTLIKEKRQVLCGQVGIYLVVVYTHIVLKCLLPLCHLAPAKLYCGGQKHSFFCSKDHHLRCGLLNEEYLTFQYVGIHLLRKMQIATDFWQEYVLLVLLLVYMIYRNWEACWYSSNLRIFNFNTFLMDSNKIFFPSLNRSLPI